MTRYAVLASGAVLLAVLCIVYPFLPGSYDSLAMSLSLMAQTLGALGTLLVAPVAAVWLAYEWRARVASRRFALAATIATWVVAMILVLVAFASSGLALGLITLAAWLSALRSLIPKLRPLYLLVIPVAVLILQLALTGPLTASSRRRAIQNADEIIGEIEKYRERVGRYPRSLAAVHADYKSGVVGVERYHYAPSDETYNLHFEQPRFLFDDVGTREFVVYNPRDEHVMVSHAAWILVSNTQEIRNRQGWYRVHDGPSPHWRCFLFD